ncbi:MAG: sigma-70 family RNA polymerase sigma factor [Candidatus Omnitrophota bacterium]
MIERCIAGDKKAWDVFVLRYSGLVFWAIKERFRRSGISYAHQEIEDIFQNLFVLLWEKNKLAQLKDHTRIAPWLVIVAAHCASNYMRSRKELPCEPETITARLSETTSALSENIEREHLRFLGETLLANLSAREQLILKLHYVFDQTHEAIAELLRLPQNTVSSIIKRTKEKLKAGLEKQGWADV